MSDRFKIVYIGAGSFRFSIVLFSDFGRATELSPMDIWLVDVDEKSLNMMYKAFSNMAKKAKKKLGTDIRVFKTTNRREAMENADFIYKSIAVGIQKSDWFDNYLPIKFGIPQNTGDTVGPGGVFRGLRTNHIAAAIAEDMKELCPKAPLLSYTNPQASIVMAARTANPNIQYIGLCHELFGGMKSLMKWYNKKMGGNVKNWEDFDVEYGGVNHFTWLTKFGYKGKDLYPELRKQAHSLLLEKFERPFNFHLLEKHNYFPYPGSRHVAEFMTDYYNHFNNEIQCPYWKFPVIRNVASLDKARRAAYRVYGLSAKNILVPKPRDLGEKAVDMTFDWKKSLDGISNTKHVVNLPNDYNGMHIIPELPKDCVVETAATFTNGVIQPVGTVHLPKEVADLVRPHAEQARLTVNAGLGNSLDLVVKAMLHDPMCKWIEDDDKIEYLTKLMLYYQKEWLPESWKEWIPKEKELKQSKWWVSPNDLVKKGKIYLQTKFPPKESLKDKAFFWND